MTLEHKISPRGGPIAIAALALALLSLLLTAAIAFYSPSTRVDDKAAQGVMAGILRTGILQVGYGGFPPYTIETLSASKENQAPTGFSVDLVNEIAAQHQPPLKVQWHRLSWDSLKADMSSGKFDFIADPVYQTIPRASAFGMSQPYSYFGIGAAVVKVDDDRFRSFMDLDRPDITIALAEGWTTSEYARKQLMKPTFKAIPVSGDAFNQLDEVILGRADVALNDVPTVVQYVNAHKNKVKALWVETPPSLVPGGFLTRPEDRDLIAFLDAAVRIVIASGKLEEIDNKWKSFGYLPRLDTVPGKGLMRVQGK